MLIDSCPNRSSSELMEQSLCANINETFQPSSNLNVAETKMIAAVVIAARSLPLPLDFFLCFLDHTINILLLPLSIVPRDPLSRAWHLFYSFAPSNYLYKAIGATLYVHD